MPLKKTALRRRRLRLEQLECRRVLTGAIAGTVFLDLDRDGGYDGGDMGIAGRRVTLDLNGDANAGWMDGFIEPDDFGEGAVLRNVHPGVTLTVVDPTGEDNFAVTANDDNFDYTSTGVNVFGHSNVNFFNETRKLKMTFTSPIEQLSIDFGGGNSIGAEVGLLEIYDSGDVLLDTYTTQALAGGVFETMSFSRGTPDIAYAIAYTNDDFGRLDNLMFSGPEPFRITDADGRYSFDALQAGAYSVIQELPSGVEQTSPTRPTSGSVFLDIPNRTDHIYDPTSGVLYTTTSTGDVHRYHVDLQQELPSFHVGVDLSAIDVGPSGEFLYVGEAVQGMRGSLVRKVDAATGRVVANYTIGGDAIESIWDIKVLSNDKAWIATEYAGSGWVPLRELDLATGEVTVKPVPPGSGFGGTIREQTWLYVTPQRDRVFATEGNISLANVYSYDVASDVFDAETQLATFMQSKPGAVKENGWMAVGGINGVTVYDSDFTIVRDGFTSGQAAVAFDPVRDLLFVADRDSDSVLSYDLTTFDETGAIPIGEDLGFTTRLEMSVTPSGRRLILETPTGVRIYDLRSLTDHAINVADGETATADFGSLDSNLKPTAVNDALKVPLDSPEVAIAVLDNDYAPLNETLTVIAVSGPDRGGEVSIMNNEIRYTPAVGFSGVERFTYDIVTPAGVMDRAAVEVTVKALDGTGQIRGRLIDQETGGGIPFADVFVDLNGDGAYEDGEPTARTTLDGDYIIDGLAPGQYEVLQVLEVGYSWLSPLAAGQSNVLAEVANLGGFVFDDSRQLLYISTTDGELKVYDVVAEEFQAASWMFGGELGRLDISPDGADLLVTDRTTTAMQGFIHRVDLVGGGVTTLAYDLVSLESGSWDVAFTANGTAFFTTRFAGSGWNPLREIDLSDNSMTQRDDSPGDGVVRQDTMIFRSADAQRLLFTEANSSAGPLFTFESSSNSFAHAAETQNFLSNANGDVSSGREQIALMRFTSALSIVDLPTLQTIELLPRLGGGVVYDPYRPVLLAADAVNDEIVAYSTLDFGELYRAPIGENIGVGDQHIDLSADGRTLLLQTPAGVRILEVSRPAPARCGRHGRYDCRGRRFLESSDRKPAPRRPGLAIPSE